MKKKRRTKRSDAEVLEYLNDKIAKCDEILKENPNDQKHQALKVNLQKMFTVLNIPVVGAQAKKILSEAMEKECWHSKEIEEPEEEGEGVAQ